MIYIYSANIRIRMWIGQCLLQNNKLICLPIIRCKTTTNRCFQLNAAGYLLSHVYKSQVESLSTYKNIRLNRIAGRSVKNWLSKKCITFIRDFIMTKKSNRYRYKMWMKELRCMQTLKVTRSSTCSRSIK